ncbi:MAG TPA: DUF1015 family protein [Thermotogota bacterium]|nr:DUF1015 family protein [Thermotogota bacterium]HPJ87645.1 DUF1015 family protein [Thermotogota bacterium]HPR94917.1 DUF1015 family protein [Thermotogota bacterium]
MAIVKAFKAIRPNTDLVEKVASKPYDVLNSNEARKEVENNRYSFLHVVKPEVDLDPSISQYDKTVYEKAAENLRKFIDERILIQDEENSLYCYEQEWKGHKQVGIVGCFSVDEYQASKIKRHEFTRRKKEDDRVNNILATNANTGPVFLTYRSVEVIDKALMKNLMNDKIYEIKDEYDCIHRVYKVSNTEELIELFEKVSALYIADGHHRAASAARVRDIKKSENKYHTGDEEYNYFLAVLFPHDQLKILDYNRVVKDLNGKTKELFLETLKKNFDLTEAANTPYTPVKQKEFGMYLDSKWYILSAKEESFDASDPVNSLDVAILQNNLLTPVLDIQDPRSDERIDFIGGIRGLKELENRVDSGEWKVAFSMYPTGMEQLLDVADADKTMPPKSTWFEPKLRSGLFVHLLK